MNMMMFVTEELENRMISSRRIRSKTMRIRKWSRSIALPILGVLLFAASDSFGQAKVGTTGAQFLELGVSARAMGMAEAFTAVVDDITAVYYNPAGLTTLYGKEMAVSYVAMPADVGFGFAAFGLPLESIGGVLAFSATGLTSGDMIETTYEDGTINGTGRSFAYNALAAGISYGRYLTDRFSVGFTVRGIFERAHDYGANGWSADVGTSYNTGFRNFRIGMAITNFGPDMRFIDNAYPLPINFKFGGSINVLEQADNVLTFSAEGSHPSDNLEKFNAGAEWIFKEFVALRAGGRFNYDVDGFTLGGGLRVPFGEERELRVDYAFQDFGILTEVHRFTLNMAF